MTLEELKATHGKCTKCPGMWGGPILFEGGKSPLMFMAEALGEHEVKAGRPLIGPSGQLFNKILAAAKIERSSVFLCNVCSCRPPKNQITASMVKNCLPVRTDIVDACSPKVIMAMGATAVKALCPKEKSAITAIRGRVLDYRGIPVVATLHPSFIMRQEQEAGNDYYGRRSLGALKAKVLSDFLLAKKLALKCSPRDPEMNGGSHEEEGDRRGTLEEVEA